MNKHKNKLFTVLLACLSVVFTGCYENAWDEHTSNSDYQKYMLSEAISMKSDLSIFSKMLKKTGYDKVLSQANSFTVFAPQNEAWANVDTANVTQLTKIVGSLIVYKSYYTDNQELYGTIKSINGKKISYDSTAKTFNGAGIITPNLQAANGVIQITDKIAERKDNIWENLQGRTAAEQYIYINSLNTAVMDSDKSVAVGVNGNGQIIYDTVWTNINNFLKQYPIDNEDSSFTYVVVSNDGFSALKSKYQPYFTSTTTVKTDSAVKFNICQDMVFRGKIDITKFDTLTNVDGVKVPVTGQISETYDASNGRVYVLNAANIKLKDKIRPIKIEGENFNSAYSSSYVYTRYKLWASGERDVALASAETQSDTLWRKLTGVRDSVASKTYYLNSGLVANTANFYIEYNAKVNSVGYDVYYVAYDDIADHFDLTYTNYGAYKIVQKLFVSLPGNPVLKRGTTDNATLVTNNYLGDTRCFAGVGLAGVKELTKLKQWDLASDTQILTSAVNPTVDVLSVPRSGKLVMWLCNTARSNTASRQGLLFLDYILLVPRLPQE